MEILDNPTYVDKLKDIKMYLNGERITFYRTADNRFRYYRIINSQWIKCYANETLLNKIEILEEDYYRLADIPYEAPPIDTTIEEPKKKSSETGNTVVKVLACTLIAALVGQVIYKHATA